MLYLLLVYLLQRQHRNESKWIPFTETPMSLPLEQRVNFVKKQYKQYKLNMNKDTIILKSLIVNVPLTGVIL